MKNFNTPLSGATFILSIFLGLAISSCNGEENAQNNTRDTLATAQNTQSSQKENSKSSPGEVEVDNLVDGLNHPWGMAFLPDNRLLVTERAGQVRIMDTEFNLTSPLKGIPEVFARGQGGMLDVALDPDFEQNNIIYLSFSEPGPNNTSSTALGKGKLENDRIRDFEVIFSQKPKVNSSSHFGGRIVFHEGYIYLTLGDRGQKDPAQDLSNTIGTIVRINPDGSVPSGNPFVGEENAEGAIWSYGHRNIEAAHIDPETGLLWVAEMGPRGGDELNHPEKGKNYGWPEVSWGENYDGTPIPDPPTRPEFADVVTQWTPVISPSGMEFYTGDVFPEWKGHMFIGGLSSEAVIIVNVDGQEAEEVDRIEMDARIRDVEQAPDGSLYVLTDQDDGNVWRLSR